MKRSKLLYPVLAAVLFAGLAQLRSGWLGAAEKPAEPSPAVSLAARAARQYQTSALHLFVRPQ